MTPASVPGGPAAGLRRDPKGWSTLLAGAALKATLWNEVKAGRRPEPLRVSVRWSMAVLQRVLRGEAAKV